MTEQPPPPTPEGPGGRRSGLGELHPRDSVDWPAALAEHERWLRTAVYARLGERHAVEEVLQEVALAAVAQRSPLADGAKAGAWLYRLAVRQALLYRRRRGRRVRLTERFATARKVDHGFGRASDPLEWVLLDETRGLVREALARLPRRDAEILLLKYSEDWTYRDLAAHLGVSLSAVEARLHRARGRLREALAVDRVTGMLE